MNQRLFVYGSLLSGLRHPLFGYINRYFTRLGTAMVQGKLYNMGEFPGAIPATDEVYIAGELYEAANEEGFNYVIERLDEYEGVQAKQGESSLFRREAAIIIFQNKKINSWIYWYNRGVEGLEQIESGDYLFWMGKE